MSHILVCIGWNDDLGRILTALRDRFDIRDTELTLVGVCPPGGLVSPCQEQGAAVVCGERFLSTRRRLEVLKLRLEQVGYRCRNTCRVGDPMKRIVEVAGEAAYDGLVMGCRHSSPLRHLFCGSLAAGLMRRLGVPVTLLPPGAGLVPARRGAGSSDAMKREVCLSSGAGACWG